MSSFGLTISPPQLELILKPGATVTQAYQITNNTDSTLFLTTTIDPWRPTDNTGSISYDNILPNPNLTFSLSNANLRLGQNFRLEPNASRQLVLKIQSDPNSYFGDSYYTFFISQSPDSLPSNFTGGQVLPRLGSHILISSSSTANPEKNLSISKFTVSPRFKDIFLTPITFSGQIENNSDFYFRPEGKITITKNNLTLKEITLDPQNVLARHNRTIQCLDSCTLNPPFWPGFYTAALSIDNLTASASISFFVFPYFLTAIALILTSLLFLLLRFRRRRH